MDEVRVQIESEDPLALAGLLAILRDRAGLRVTGREAAGDADVILLDPGWKPAAEAMARLEEDGPPVLLLVRQDDPDLPAGLPFGAVRGLLPRTTGGETLAAALAAVGRGLLVADPAFPGAVHPRRPAGTPAGPVRSEGPTPGQVPSLSPREREVLLLVAEGLPNKTIAHRLGISEHTVKFHLNSLLAKLGAQSRTEVAVLAMRLGLLAL